MNAGSNNQPAMNAVANKKLRSEDSCGGINTGKISKDLRKPGSRLCERSADVSEDVQPETKKARLVSISDDDSQTKYQGPCQRSEEQTASIFSQQVTNTTENILPAENTAITKQPEGSNTVLNPQRTTVNSCGGNSAGIKSSDLSKSRSSLNTCGGVDVNPVAKKAPLKATRQKDSQNSDQGSWRGKEQQHLLRVTPALSGHVFTLHMVFTICYKN